MLTAQEGLKPLNRAEAAIRRAQVYAFLAPVYLYPTENWSEDLPLVQEITAELDFAPAFPTLAPLPLEDLQQAYRRVFGATGSLCYETEYGLPHEYRQAQELADINGFYRAFGFALGGQARERPDHIAAELEFMYILALKEAHALAAAQEAAAAPRAPGLPWTREHAQLCVDAQAKFLGEHLGVWAELFAQSVATNTSVQRSVQDELYRDLARFTAAFVHADAGRLGVTVAPRHREQVQHTPFDPDFSCAACPAVDLVR
jgi:putative dimethyl sulfoxide reductase chaperone